MFKKVGKLFAAAVATTALAAACFPMAALADEGDEAGSASLDCVAIILPYDEESDYAWDVESSDDDVASVVWIEDPVELDDGSVASAFYVESFTAGDVTITATFSNADEASDDDVTAAWSFTVDEDWNFTATGYEGPEELADYAVIGSLGTAALVSYLPVTDETAWDFAIDDCDIIDFRSMAFYEEDGGVFQENQFCAFAAGSCAIEAQEIVIADDGTYEATGITCTWQIDVDEDGNVQVSAYEGPEELAECMMSIADLMAEEE